MSPSVKGVLQKYSELVCCEGDTYFIITDMLSMRLHPVEKVLVVLVEVSCGKYRETSDTFSELPLHILKHSTESRIGKYFLDWSVIEVRVFHAGTNH